MSRTIFLFCFLFWFTKNTVSVPQTFAHGSTIEAQMFQQNTSYGDFKSNSLCIAKDCMKYSLLFLGLTDGTARDLSARASFPHIVTDFPAFKENNYFLSALITFNSLKLGYGIGACITFPFTFSNAQNFVTIGRGINE